MFAADVPKVLAFGDENAASYWRQERARNGGASAPRVQPSFFRTLDTFRPAASALAPRESLPRLESPVRGEKPLKRRTAKAERAEKAAKAAKESAGASASSAEAGESGGSARSVCVRLCDGFHFPVGNAPSSSEMPAHEAVCSALCPGAPTRLYVMPGGTDDIGRAYSAREGRSYAALPVALRHTNRHDNTCSCRRNNETHASMVSLYRDFTLRQGDAVMTQKGFQIFRGAKQWPYRDRDFARLDASSVNGRERRALVAMERVSVGAPPPSRAQSAQQPRILSVPIPAVTPRPVKRDDRPRVIEMSPRSGASAALQATGAANAVN